jgi:protein DGCR14
MRRCVLSALFDKQISTLYFYNVQEKYSGIRPGTGHRLASPATFETPQEPLRDVDPRRPASSFSDLPREGSVSRESGTGDKEVEEVEKVNLDKFLANHTSEDNESFNEIQEEAFARHR